MGCLLVIIGIGLLGGFGFNIPDGQEWIGYAGMAVLAAGFFYPSDENKKSA